MFVDSKRRLVVIMFTDIVGYTSLMGTDQDAALDLLDKNRAIHKSVIERWNGRLLKEMGDGNLASFTSTLDAVYCAGAIQKEASAIQGLELRIGLHQGEVLVQNSDIFGDGVNIASRIEQIAGKGQILASDVVYRNIRNKKGIKATFLVETTFKNVNGATKIYSISVNDLDDVLKASPDLDTASTLNSIAVLPFANMSSDPEQEYFCDGLAEELLNLLSQVKGLKVAARTSSFSFKDQNEDISKIGRELRVQAVLEGSVRKSGNRLRITAQLIEVNNGYHLWSQRYDREVSDIFDIQDEISVAILDALKLKLVGSQSDNLQRRHVENIAAYDFYLQGRFYFNKWTEESYQKAINYYQQAIEIEPDYALAHAGLGEVFQNLWFFGFMPAAQSLKPMKDSALRAIALDPGICESHVVMGRVRLHYEWDLLGAEKAFKKAIALNPNYADAHDQCAFALHLQGKIDNGSLHTKKALELDPFSAMINLHAGYSFMWSRELDKIDKQGHKLRALYPDFFGGYFLNGYVHFAKTEYNDSIPLLKKVTTLAPMAMTEGLLGLALALNGDHEEAKVILARIDAMITEQKTGIFFRGLIQAGLGKYDLAMKDFEASYNAREGIFIHSQVWLRFMVPSILSDSRMKALIKRTWLDIPNYQWS